MIYRGVIIEALIDSELKQVLGKRIYRCVSPAEWLNAHVNAATFARPL